MNAKSKNIWTPEEEAKLQELLKRRQVVYDESAENLRDVITATLGGDVFVHDAMLDAFIGNAENMCDALAPFLSLIHI